MSDTKVAGLTTSSTIVVRVEPRQTVEGVLQAMEWAAVRSQRKFEKALRKIRR